MSFSVTCVRCGRYVSIEKASGNTNSAGYTCDVCRSSVSQVSVNRSLEEKITSLENAINELSIIIKSMNRAE